MAGPGMDGHEIAMFIGTIVLGYLLGSLSGSLLVGRLRGLDIRQHGSGNAGGTNALRVAGWKFALAVVVIDVGKGVLAALIGGWQAAAGTTPAAGPTVLVALCGFAAVLGHCWPLFFGFRGGKGAGTAVGCVLVMAPWMAGMMILVWICVVAATRYVSLSTVAAALAFPGFVVAATLLKGEPSPVLQPFALAIAALLVFTHRSNLRRLLRKEEPRLGQRQEPT